MNHTCRAVQWRLLTKSTIRDCTGHWWKGLLLWKNRYRLAHFQEVQHQRLLGLTQNNKSGDQCNASQGATFQSYVLQQEGGGVKGCSWIKLNVALERKQIFSSWKHPWFCQRFDIGWKLQQNSKTRDEFAEWPQLMSQQSLFPRCNTAMDALLSDT